MEPCLEAQPKLYGMESAAYDSKGHMERKEIQALGLWGPF